MKTRDEDFVAQLIIDSTHAYLLCFTNTGRVYWLKIYEIPDTGITGKGKAMASLLDLQPGEKVVTILPVRNLTEEGKNILFATRNGTVKKTPLSDFSNVMARGIIAIDIDKDDELITVRSPTAPTSSSSPPTTAWPSASTSRTSAPWAAPPPATAASTSARATSSSAPPSPPRPEARDEAAPRARRQARGIGLTRSSSSRSSANLPHPPPRSSAHLASRPATLDGQELLGSDAPEIDPAAQAKLDKLDEKLGLTPCLILTVSENGFGKRTDVDRYRLQSRGGTGVINMKAHAKIGKVTSIMLVDDTTEIMVISPVRQNHPHRHQERPRRRPQHLRRQAPRPRRRTTR